MNIKNKYIYFSLEYKNIEKNRVFSLILKHHLFLYEYQKIESFFLKNNKSNFISNINNIEIFFKNIK